MAIIDRKPAAGSSWFQRTLFEQMEQKITKFTPIDNSFIPAKTVKEAEKYLVENDIVDHADFGKITDMALINDWNKALFDTIKEFPKLRVNQEFTGSAQSQASRWYRLEIESATQKLIDMGFSEESALKAAERNIEKVSVAGFASSWSSGFRVGGIAFNELYEIGYSDILKHVAETDYWAQGSENLKYVVDHELGHQLDDLIKISNQKEVVTLFNRLKNDNLIKSEVSIYAETNIREFVAECWAEFRNSSSPREAAIIVGESINRRYRDRFSLPENT